MHYHSSQDAKLLPIWEAWNNMRHRGEGLQKVRFWENILLITIT
jgi:hypothetical protein